MLSADEDFIMLATNLIKKDLVSDRPAILLIVLSSVTEFVNGFLAREILSEIVGLLNHAHPAVRKKSMVVLNIILMNFADLMATFLVKLKERLGDKDTG